MSDEQMTIDDGIAAAIAARDEAIDRVEKNSHPEWAEAAYLACCLVAECEIEFTTDSVWDMLAQLFPQYATHEPRAMGAVMRRAAREGKIIPTDEYWKSTRAECHRRPLTVWESLIYELQEY